MIDYVLAVYTGGGRPLFSTRLRGQAPTGMQNYYKTMKKTIFARINKKRQGYPFKQKRTTLPYRKAISLQFFLDNPTDSLATQTALEYCAIRSKENDMRY